MKRFTNWSAFPVRIVLVLMCLSALLSSVRVDARIGGYSRTEWPFKPEQLSSLEGISDACLSQEADFKTQRKFNEGWRSKIACARLLADRLPKLDPANRFYFGEYYDPEKWVACETAKIKVSADDRKDPFYQDDCHRYALLRTPNPEQWPYPELPKPKFPEPPATPTWQPGMTPQQYHGALCEKEAGQFITRTVDDVESFYIIRPRNAESGAHFSDRYVLENPWGVTSYGTLGSFFVYNVPGEQHWQDYPFTERGEIKQFVLAGPNYWSPTYFLAPPPGTKFERYFVVLGSQGNTPLRKEYDTEIRSRYGLYWRGIDRPRDRENGIAGGELFVIDLKTNEIIAVQRNFMWARESSKGSYNWLTARACRMPKESSRYFVREVIRPKTQLQGQAKSK